MATPAGSTGASDGHPLERASGVPPPRHDGRTPTILLVSEDHGTRDLLGAALRGRGYLVLEARHEGQALLICMTETRPIDLLITEGWTPESHGWRLGQKLAGLRPGLKSLLIPGSQGSPCPELPADPAVRWLKRPFTASMLDREVRRLLDSPTGKDEAGGGLVWARC